MCAGNDQHGSASKSFEWNHFIKGSNRMQASKNIVIVGGGFAGTTLARALDRSLPPGYRLLVISEESYTTFHPLLPEAVGASVFPEQVVAPIRQMLSLGRFIMGVVTVIDPLARSLRCSTLAGEIDVVYDQSPVDMMGEVPRSSGTEAVMSRATGDAWTRSTGTRRQPVVPRVRSK